jgi:hypothetical protein
MGKTGYSYEMMVEELHGTKLVGDEDVEIIIKMNLRKIGGDMNCIELAKERDPSSFLLLFSSVEIGHLQNFSFLYTFFVYGE